jgi:hypothetical protein
MRRCWGITRKRAFCKRQGEWWLFCPAHKYKLWRSAALLVLPGIIYAIHLSGSLASIATFLIGPPKQDMQEAVKQVSQSLPQNATVLPPVAGLRVRFGTIQFDETPEK